MKKYGLVIFSLLTICVVGCKDNKSNTFANRIEQPLEPNALLKGMIVNDTLTKSVAVNGKLLFSQNSLPEFYKDVGYILAWSDQKNREDLLTSLQRADEEGLIPEDYHLQQIKQLLDQGYDHLNEEELVELDLYLTDAVLLYGAHLRLGKVDQKTIRSEWDVELNKIPVRVDSLLVLALKNRNIKEGLEGVKPQHPMYSLLKAKLAEQREIADKGGWDIIDFDEKLEEGDSALVIPQIIKRLQVTGEYKDDFPVDSLVYNQPLLEAIKIFQEKHNLNPDGVIGKGTIEEMNVPVEERIETIRVNLERFRWVLDEDLDDFLVVNIAGFKVYRMTKGKVVFESRVIVGKYHKESPIFRDKMEYIVLNPTWTLPYSISTRETLPRLKKNPGYLAAKHMEIMDRNGKVLNPNNIDFSQYSTGHFPFIIRQKAGPWNALGQVKFIFPNKYSVYLHDTPSRNLFEREFRAFSHGCIRTQDKWGLLLNLMAPTGDWDMDRINDVLKSGETTKIILPQPIDILLLYFTASVNRKGQLNFNKDVYRRDALVIEALNKPYVFERVN